MFPAQFEYFAPATLAEALSLLAQHKDEAKILAGGHSLIPAMKLRLAQPQMLIDIGRIRELSYIRQEGDQIRIGATTTHAEIESSDLLNRLLPIMPEAASHIGDIQVRNRGTFGGSLAHADPAADWPAVAIALRAEMIAVSARGERAIPADDFFVGMLTTALEPDEILREVRIPIPQGKFGQSYMKVHHPASGFAVVGVAVTLGFDQSGTCQSAGVGITGVSSKAYRATGIEGELKGKKLDDQVISSAASRVADGVDINGDLYASAEYRKHLAEVYARRAIQAALSRAG